MRIWENKIFIPVHSSELFILLPQECSMCCLFHRKSKKENKETEHTKLKRDFVTDIFMMPKSS